MCVPNLKIIGHDLLFAITRSHIHIILCVKLDKKNQKRVMWTQILGSDDSMSIHGHLNI